MSTSSLQEHHPVTPRRASFDWHRTPLLWIPDEPTATHVVNVLHLLLPAGERWFVKVFKEGFPLVGDDQLRKDVKVFMGQEAIHSVQHSHVLDHLAHQGLETGPYTRHINFLFKRLLGDRPPCGVSVPGTGAAALPALPGRRHRAVHRGARELGAGRRRPRPGRARPGPARPAALARCGGGRAPGGRVRHVPAHRRRGSRPVRPPGAGHGRHRTRAAPPLGLGSVLSPPARSAARRPLPLLAAGAQPGRPQRTAPLPA